MKKIALTVLLMLAAFITPALTSAEMSPKAPPAGRGKSVHASTMIAKDSDDFEIVSHHGELYFTITPLDNEGIAGQWQALVVTPDGRRFKGDKVNFSGPSAPVIITVRHPIVFGTYTLVFKNIDGVVPSPPIFPYTGPIFVTNSYNQFIGTIYEQTENGFAQPKDYFEISYTPFRNR